MIEKKDVAVLSEKMQGSAVMIKSRFVSVLALVGASIICNGSVRAQTWLRDGGRCFEPYTHNTEGGALIVKPGAGGGYVFEWVVVQNNSPSVELLFVDNRPGDIAGLLGRKFLVSSFSVNESTSPPTALDGRLQLVELVDSPRAINILASQVVVGRDLSAIFYNEGENVLYAYDEIAQELVAGYFDEANPVFPVPFLAIMDVTGLPWLGRGTHRVMRPTVSGAGVHLFYPMYTHPTDIYGHDVVYTGSAWAAAPLVGQQPLAQWQIVDAYPNALGTSLRVTGGTGSFVVSEVGGASVVSGVASGGIETVTFPAGTLTPGAKYEVQDLAGSSPLDSPWITINSTWGSACDSASVTVQRDVASGLFVGNAAYNASSQLMWADGTSVATETRNAYLLLSFAIPGLEAVSVDAGGCATMDAVGAIVGPISVDINGQQHGHAFVPLPFPNSPALVGIHVLHQWLVEDGGVFAKSEIYGSLIFPGMTSAAAAAGPGLGGLSGQPAAARMAALKCAKDWIKTSPTLSWTPSKLQALNGLGLHR